MLVVRFHIGNAKASQPLDGFIPNPKLKLLDQVSEVMRFKHYSLRTETTYRDWIKRYIFFHGKRHPREMGAVEVGRFLSDLAVRRRVAASTQNQAFNALLFLYRDVLRQEFTRVACSTWAGQKSNFLSVYQYQCFEWPNLATSFAPAGENLVGWINHKSAALVVTSPIIPTPEVRQLISRFDIVVDPRSGLALTYRRQGNALLDSSYGIAECAYGAAPGVAAALMRICSP